MSKGINKVILIGNIGQDPEVSYFASGDAFCNVSLATSESWKDKQTGEQKEATEWHKLAFFGKLAEVVGKYLKKGSKIYVEGSLRTRKWQDKEGKDRYTTEVRVADMQMLDGKPADGQSAPAKDSGKGYADAKGGAARRTAAAEKPQQPAFEDDDIPPF